jgi:hypothetical protein
MVEFAHVQESPDERYVAQLEGEIQRLREAAEDAIRMLAMVPGRRHAQQLMEVRVHLRETLDAR